MPLHGPLHLDVVAVIRSQKVRAYKQQNDISRVEVCIYLACPFRSCANPTVVPARDHTLALQNAEVLL